LEEEREKEGGREEKKKFKIHKNQLYTSFALT
jgi:hypothetical protein